MSAFFGKVYADGIHILTDAATYSRQTSVVTHIGRKIWAATKLPVAVYGRGEHNNLRAIASEIIRVADASENFDAVIAWLIENLPALRLKLDGTTNHVEIVVAGWSPETGFAQHTFATWGDENGDAFVLGKVDSAWAAPALSWQDWQEIGAAPNDVFGEGLPWFERHGADIFEKLRHIPQRNYFEPAAESACLVGGHVDLTTITDSGVEMRTLRTWPDAIGKRIDPNAIGQCAVTTQKVVNGAISTTSAAYSEGSQSIDGSSEAVLQSVTITTTGNPVFILWTARMSPDGANDQFFAPVRMYRDSTQVETRLASIPLNWTSVSGTLIDEPAAGTYTYELRSISPDTENVFSAANRSLIVFELKR